ncbi:MAG: beta-propeller fold lactonase family protein [Pseudomonadota bacterium]
MRAFDFTRFTEHICAAVLATICLALPASGEVPQFDVVPDWIQLPENVRIGQVSGLTVDQHDNVWILQRPNSWRYSEADYLPLRPSPSCCRGAPHVLQLSPEGEILTAWGGPGRIEDDGRESPRWPNNVHGLFVDHNDTVWIGGNGDDDHLILNFDAEGNFLRFLGERDVTAGNASQSALGNPADMFVDPAREEVFVADGYINKRIISFDLDTGEFKRLWGAYGERPGSETRDQPFDQSQATSAADGGANPISRSFGDIVHCIEQGPKGRLYVCDRRNNRVQIFDINSDGKTVFVENLPVAPDSGGPRSATDIAFSPDGQHMYVADMANSRIWILDAESYQTLGHFGDGTGTEPGQFIWLHSVAVDSQGNVYTSEVNRGRRVQKFAVKKN